ncbi:precorrin-6y C5,15-methyltransferase (decarboxylating) subunit CbiE [Nocardia stercoris]|uniref:Precorrin-6y C5,15-methyltransferase (Decarboxylating) subunit CbiE n=1 Tax=Nocardia stercoris TaxID=2483361 RepID=A0A3M2L3T7_9NOCA|nr:precorrin-6y C5,15-methyltransferase (decarboxylating) subunit CbiE [Nocardia stercoris]RMI32317.1 precorrin-6y C5,15-methyltransferase (decarboxylating) subunit CbiE [Nocardia stercoris]
MASISVGAHPISVVGIGADGWEGLGAASRAAIAAGDVVFGSRRQLALVPDGIAGERVPWPSPLVPALPDLLVAHGDRRMTVLASGDPMFYGIGVTLAGLVGPQALRVYPAPSSASLACARLGWALAETPVVSAVGRPMVAVLPELADRRRLLVLTPDAKAPAELSELLTHNGFGGSRLTVLEELGGPAEHLVTGIAANWTEPPGAALNLVAVECVADPGALRSTRVPGLADEVYRGDGQMTKAEVRALSISALAPAPGEVLWDIGGGSGTIAIEWCRTHPSCRAVTFEQAPARRDQIAVNAAALGAVNLDIRGAFPGALDDATLPDPDAVFLGGGLTQPGLFESCWDRLPSGGRLVANAVTAEAETLLLNRHSVHGGTLRKLQVYRAEPLGGFTAWRPHLPVAQWSVVKP